MSMNTNQALQDVTVEMTAEQEAYSKAEKRRFIIAVVIAILGTLTAFSESGDGNASLVGMMIGTPMAFVLFGGIPYGWNLVSKVTRYFVPPNYGMADLFRRETDGFHVLRLVLLWP